MINELKKEIAQCKICEHELPLGAKPICLFTKKSKIAIIGQAPGIRVHNSGIPWNDPSGDNLRNWMGINKSKFYDDDIFAIVPMGFCYPGTGKSGDLPPRKECAPTWHNRIWETNNIELFLLIGKYAQDYYLKDKENLTSRVKNFEQYLPKYFVLPHPSPRNNIWQKKNPWFKENVLDILQQIIKSKLS